jgi:hypothetical protein
MQMPPLKMTHLWEVQVSMPSNLNIYSSGTNENLSYLQFNGRDHL